MSNKKSKRNKNREIKKHLAEILRDRDTKLAGATVFPVDTTTNINSEHHPWACSLRTRGFRGRHRCGVTLLSGDESNHLICIKSFTLYQDQQYSLPMIHLFWLEQLIVTTFVKMLLLVIFLKHAVAEKSQILQLATSM